MRAKRSKDDTDFTGELEDWEERVFLNALGFRLHRFYGQGGADRAQVLEFPEAVRLLREELGKPGVRVMLYAVAASGRWFLVPEAQWDRYLKLWEEQHATKDKGTTSASAGGVSTRRKGQSRARVRP